MGPRRVGEPKFRAFFSLPPPFSLFLCLLGDCSWNFGGVLKHWELSCEAPAAPKPPGVSHDNPRAQMDTFEGPGLLFNNQNSTRRYTKREKRNEMVGGEGKKKERNLGRPCDEGSGAEWSKPTTTPPTRTTKTTPNNTTTHTKHNTKKHRTHNTTKHELTPNKNPHQHQPELNTTYHNGKI